MRAKEGAKFRKVENIFGDLFSNAASWERSYDLVKEADYSELAIINFTMDDGLVIEECYWHESDLFYYDLSVNKEKFDAAYDITFEEYLRNKGMPAENVEDPLGYRFIYYGQYEKGECYRVTLRLDDESEVIRPEHVETRPLNERIRNHNQQELRRLKAK